MQKISRLGPVLFAMAIACLAVIQLVIQNFLTGLLPVPSALPLRLVWVILSSLLLLLSSFGIIFNIRPSQAATLGGLVFFVFALLLHVPLLIGDLHNGGEWTAMFESVGLGSGSVMIAYILSSGDGSSNAWQQSLRRLSVIGQYLFALVLIVFGVLHVTYESYIRTLIPSWMPLIAFWSYLVIAAFFLSAGSFLLGTRLSLACWMLASMFLIWVLILHAPRSISKLNVEPEWSSLCIALAFGAIGLSLAMNMSLFKRKPVGSIPLRDHLIL